jgi:repressor LexA
MRYKDPDKINKIVEIIEYWRLKEGTEPTITQIAEDARMSRSCVHAYLKEMDERGIITYSRRRYDTSRTEMISDDVNMAPVCGSVKCGDPQLEEAEILEYVRLPASIFGNKEMYILKAKGDSMEDAGIEEGDIVVVENRQYPEKNEIVVAMDEEGANTLKRYKGTNEKGQATLAFENERRYHGKEIHLDQMRIQGIARFVIKKL